MRRFAKEKLKHWIRVVLHTKDSPDRTSLAFAVGVFISFLPPVPYFHTLFALVVAFVFRLNRLAVLIGSYVNTPLTMAPVLFLELSVGFACLGAGEAPEITWRQLSKWQGWKDAAAELQPLVAPLMLGCMILGLAASVASYFLALALISRYRRHTASGASLLSSGGAETSAPATLAGAKLVSSLRGTRGGGPSGGPGARGASAVDTPENHS